MASLKLEHIYKVYPNGTKAVNDISLDIQNGEFIVFVGPSGCGKSTTLRMIAGLEDITAGELYIDNAIVNDVEPKDRDIAMVFQNYALYPHMSVYENMAFGLRLRHVPDDIIQEKVLWASEILGIKEYLDRKPRNMSGGQRQRVALGRAILRDPKVMLLDEPLSNLDAKLRTQMRTEIAKLHQKLKTTFIYVTHDQTEAMTLGDRVVVMRNGRIQQVDTPKILYKHPANKFVAGFIGTPQMNFFPVTLLRERDNVLVHFKDNDVNMNVPYNLLMKVLPSFLDGKHPITFGIRCESVHLATKEEKNVLPVTISHFEELGSESLIYGNITSAKEDISSSKGQIIIKVKEIENLHSGDVIYCQFDMDKAYFFDDETEKSIVPRIPEYNSIPCKVKDNHLVFMGNELLLPNILETPDLDDLELQLPCEAILLNQEGFKAKVTEVEEIKGQRLVHLLCEDKTFFALAKKEDEVHEGEEISLGLDFTLLTLINQKNKTKLFKPLDEFDSFHAAFYNYSTVISKNPDPEFISYREDKIKACEDYMNAKILLENQEYEKKKLALDSLNIEEEKKKGLESLTALSEKNNKEIEEILSSSKKELSSLKEQYKKDKEEAIRKNDALFKEKREKEESEYKEFVKNNHDPDALKRRRDEYHIFKDNFNLDKENTINRILNGMSLDYESKVSSIRASRKRKVDLLRKEIHDAKLDYKKKSNPYYYLEKEHNHTLNLLAKEKEASIQKASYVFFLQFVSNYYCLANDIISNKLIQGLGTRVFSKDFLVEIPHDGYTITKEEKGLAVTVENCLDYSKMYFIRCSYQNEGNIGYLYLKSPISYPKGTKLHLLIDLNRSQITETEMNIRLY